MSEQKVPIVSGQQLLDSGFNVFGLQLFLKSMEGFPDIKTFNPLSFVYQGVKITLEPAPQEITNE